MDGRQQKAVAASDGSHHTHFHQHFGLVHLRLDASAGSSGLTGGGFPWVTPVDVAGGFHFVGGYYVSRASANASTMSWTTISPRVSGTVSVITAKRIGSNVHVYAGTDSGKCPERHSARGASTSGWTMRHMCTEVAATITRAEDSGRMVEPKWSATAAVSVVDDSISATTRALRPMRRKASSTNRRMTL